MKKIYKFIFFIANTKYRELFNNKKILENKYLPQISKIMS